MPSIQNDNDSKRENLLPNGHHASDDSPENSVIRIHEEEIELAEYQNGNGHTNSMNSTSYLNDLIEKNRALEAAGGVLDPFEEIGNLPEKYKPLTAYNICGHELKLPFNHQNGSILVSAACAAGASGLYLKASETAGLKYQIGGVGANLIQNLQYGISAYYGLGDGWKTNKIKLLISSTLAMIAGIPGAVATYHSYSRSVLMGLINFLGNSPFNIYGMSAAITALSEKLFGNKKARQFLETMHRAHLQTTDPELLRFLGREHGKAVTIPGTLLGFAIGVYLTAGMAGYFCDTEVEGETQVSDMTSEAKTQFILGLIIAIVSNAPAFSISLLISGLQLGQDMVTSLVDFCQDLYDYFKHGISFMSKRELKYLGAFLAMAAPTIYLAAHSQKTSENLYASCPTSIFPAFVNILLSSATSYGTAGFNGIMSLLAEAAGLRYALTAYVEPGSADEKKYKEQAKQSWYRNAPISKVEKLCQEKFAAQASQWKKAPSSFSWRNYAPAWCGGNNNAANYSQLDDNNRSQLLASPQ